MDLGILGEKYDNEKLQYMPLLKEKLVLISPKHIEFKNPVNIQEVLNYPFVMRHSSSGTNSVLERFLKENHITKEQMNITAYTDSSQSLIQFVKEGIGKEYDERNLIHMYDIEDFNNERDFYLVYNINRTQSVVSKKFIENAIHFV